MFRTTTVALIFLVGFLAGCATQMLSDSRIRENTAGVLGVSPSDITIRDRREQVPNTYYIARTKSGRKYACVINGGSILALGMVNPPTCHRK